MKSLLLFLALSGGALATTLVPDATNLWYNAPQAVNIAGTTHFTYVNNNGQLYVQSLQRDGSLTPPVLLHDWKQIDDHDSPVLVQMKAGKYKDHYVAVYARHNSDLMLRISLRPNDLTQWQPAVKLQENATYPQVYVGPDERLYIFFRRYRAGDLGLKLMTVPGDLDLGRREERMVVRFPKDSVVYFTTTYRDGRFGLAWNYYNYVLKKHQFLHVAVSDTRGITWSTPEGQAIPNLNTHPPVYTQPDDLQLRAWHMQLTAEGKPIVGFMQYDREFIPCCGQEGANLGHSQVMLYDGHVQQIDQADVTFYPSGLFVDADRRRVVYAKRENDTYQLRAFNLTDRTSCAFLKSSRPLTWPRFVEQSSGDLIATFIDWYRDLNDFRTDLLIVPAGQQTCQ
ncbi:BNR-4 repeat-containing protein [Deinococcus fonticola]|uniref:BNR-4 repeat-containing protein n=1 Tax=Deinococcus fonticola TaxID=2528713 RepID=UPI00142FCDC5|nr:BNR-4 repeat-containing protein [Deinococcus fonticola]